MTRQTLMAAASAMLALSLSPAGAAAPVSDLSITNTDFAATYTAGTFTVYTIVVSNAGPDNLVGATVTDALSAFPQVAGLVWTCVGAGGATCTAGPLGFDINDTAVNLPVGGTVTYTLTVTLRSTAVGTMVNTATVTPPTGTTDPGPGGNVAVDTDAAASLFYVAVLGADSATCGSVANPCKTIKYTFDHVAHSGDTVIVHTGIYNECITFPSGGLLGGIRLESDELIASGTNATTILDGAGVCDAASATPGPVVTVSDKSSLRGFTITNGGGSGVNALGAVAITNNVITGNKSALSGLGGGVTLITGAFLTDPNGKAEINFNRILNNTSAVRGAGLLVQATGSGVPSLVEIHGNTISGNVAGDGAGNAEGAGVAVYAATSNTTDSSRVVLTVNTLDGNVAKSNAALARGGGLFVSTGAGVGNGTETITIGALGNGNLLRNNVSEGIGGGISIAVQPPATGGKHTVDVVANTISANSAVNGGGGAHVAIDAVDLVAGSSPNAVVHITGNSIIGNHAQGSLSDPNASGGGGLLAGLTSRRSVAATATLEISGNSIERNDAAPFGGGASLLASADDDPSSDGATAPADAFIWLHNNLIAANAAHDTTAAGVSGGALHELAVARGASAHAELNHDFLTVTSNQTELGSGGLELEDQHLPNSLSLSGTTAFTLANSIVSHNDGYGVGGTIIPGGATALNVNYTDAFGNGSADYEAQLGITPGTNGNISLDPHLDNLFLPRICGPVIDAGDPAISPALEPLPNGGRVNLGHLGNTTSATRTFPDVNHDGTIDGLDILRIAVAFGATSPDPRYLAAADRDFNLIVDGDDLAYVTAFFAQSCP